VAELLKLPGAKLLWGGEELKNHTIPAVYGAVKPTAVFVPLSAMRSKKAFKLATTEVFGPLQVITDYNKAGKERVKNYLERMEQNLTAAIVSNDLQFQQEMLGATVNGTTYVGRRARTTGAPQNHWFGPAGDPRGAGIGSVEAIQMVWSCHREVIHDVGPIPADHSLKMT
jgi:1-pyrroline-5-carboxylate dehydrogenase